MNWCSFAREPCMLNGVVIIFSFTVLTILFGLSLWRFTIFLRFVKERDGYYLFKPRRLLKGSGKK